MSRENWNFENHSFYNTGYGSGKISRKGVVKGEAHAFVHGKIYEAENDNVGVEAAHRSELVTEAGIRRGTRFIKKRIRQHPARAARRAESKNIKATADYQYCVAARDNPDLSNKSALARYWQKQRQKKQYAKTAREGAKAVEKTAVTTEKLAAKTVAFVKRHPVGTLAFLACFLLLVIMQSCMASMMMLGNGLTGAVGASSYTSEDADKRGAEAAYCAMEAELQDKLDNYERAHSYDEYHYDLMTLNTIPMCCFPF